MGSSFRPVVGGLFAAAMFMSTTSLIMACDLTRDQASTAVLEFVRIAEDPAECPQCERVVVAKTIAEPTVLWLYPDPLVRIHANSIEAFRLGFERSSEYSLPWFADLSFDPGVSSALRELANSAESEGQRVGVVVDGDVVDIVRRAQLQESLALLFAERSQAEALALRLGVPVTEISSVDPDPVTEELLRGSREALEYGEEVLRETRERREP